MRLETAIFRRMVVVDNKWRVSYHVEFFFVFAKKKIKVEKKPFNVHIFNKFKHASNKTSQLSLAYQL